MDDTTAQITLRVQSTQTSAPCPLCATPARRIHSDYGRTLADLPWAQYRVCLQLRVRKWFCRNRACPRRIFTERLPTVAVPWARRTLRLTQRLVALGMALGEGWDAPRPAVGPGREPEHPAARATPAAGPIVSHTQGAGRRRFRPAQTAHLRHDPGGSRAPAARGPAPGAHRRASSPVAPGAPRGGGHRADRSSAYGDGARHGAPAATQVADRFHLLQNLREALDQVFSTHSQALDAVNVLVHQQPVPLPDGAMAVPVPPQDLSLPAQQRAVQRQGRRQALHTQVWALHRQGWTAPAIAQHVGMSLRTVQRDLQSATFAGRKRRSDLGDSVLTPYKPYLLERWNAGCYTAMRLFRDLRQRGYAGGYGVVAAYVRRLRQAQGLPPGHRCPRQALPPVAEPPCQPLTPRRATWLVLRREAKRTEAEAQQLAQCARSRPRSPRRSTWRRTLRPWSASGNLKRLTLAARATASTLEALQRFAKGLYEDYEAVKAGVTLPWSTGPVEGHINRLKMLKRQMFGRARLDLLSRRFVEAPRGDRPRLPAHLHRHRRTPRPHSHAGRQRHRGHEV